jgi:hypothetical protein
MAVNDGAVLSTRMAVGRPRPRLVGVGLVEHEGVRVRQHARGQVAVQVQRDLRTKIVQGWPKFWANVRALIGILSQSVGPSLANWANPVQFSLRCVWSSRDHF